MIRTWILIGLLFCTGISALAQSKELTVASRPRRVPELHSADRSVIIDEAAVADGQSFTWRSGQDVPLPLTPGAVLRMGLDAGLPTKKLKDGQFLGRSLQLRAPIENPNQGKYADRDFLVETIISGHGSGIARRSFLRIDPRQILVEVRSTDYIVIGKKGNEYIVLKPGKWRFDLRCSLTQVVTLDGETWKLADDAEAVGIQGDAFGTENRIETGEDLLWGFSLLNPAGSIIQGIGQLRKLGKAIIRRPDMLLPAGTDLYFRIEQLRGTYLGPSTPKAPMEAKGS